MIARSCEAFTVRKIAAICSLLSVFFACPIYAQQWSGIIDPTRAVDWSQAGIPGGIPNRTTQCGATIAAFSGTAATINSAIASCPAGQFVSLGAGVFNLSSGISFGSHSNVTLRGQGANSTFLVFTGAGAGGYNSVVSMEGSVSANGYEDNVCDWTSGYSLGSTVITLANCGGTTPAKGNLANLKVGSPLILDQLDEAADTGTIWNCATQNLCANTIQGGEARTDGPCNSPMCLRSQQQGVVVTAINGSSISISPGLYMPNWRSSQKPQAWFATTNVTADGLEDVSIDTSTAGSNQSVMIANCNQCWVKGIRAMFANRSHVRMLLATHFVVRDSYFYENLSHASVSYGAEMMGGWDGLIENNIFQQDTDSEPSCSGACAGNVISYNFDIDNVWTQSAGWMQAGYYQHAAGDVFNLWEGNIGPGYNADQVHGTHHFETLFRNYLIGNQPAGCGNAGLNTCTAQTIPVQIYSGARYFNIIGNVLGQQGYHNKYWCNATSGSSCSGAVTSIFVTGFTNNGGGALGSITGFCGDPTCATRGDFDPQVGTYLFRWGNYDTVTGAVRWCGNSSNTGWSTTCASTSEVPSGIALFANPVPTVGDTGAGQAALPASLYYSSKPNWWPSGKAWPAIGPDVTGGNVSGLGGHANTNPAQDCYVNTMGGVASGIGSVISFSASACYGLASPPPAPPTNLKAIVN